MQNPQVHDLRPLVPAQRHALAMQSFEALGAGQAFEFINDHEPRGLLMQFKQLYGNAFGWELMQAEPGLWRIRVSKVAGAAMAGADGACCSCSCSA